MKRDLGAAAFFVALAIAMTWPLARILGRGVSDPYDPVHLAWVLDWDWWATFHRPLHLFDANIFYPARDALAFSENMYGLAIFLFPLRAFGVSAVTAHNVALIGAFAFCGFGAYLLGRSLTGSAIAGIAAGVFYAYLPWRMTQLPHIAYVNAGWLPILLFALLRYSRKPTFANAALFAFAFLMNGLSNLHWLAFGSLAIALTVPIFVPPRHWHRIVIATAIALALLTPFLVPYANVARAYGMKRGWDETMHYSATLRGWINPGFKNPLYARMAVEDGDPETWLFPGFLGCAFSIAGMIATRDRRTLGVVLLWLCLGILGSLGLHAFVHRFLFGYVPGFRGIRVPARWASIAYVGMAMLIAIATAVLSKRRFWIGAAVAAAFVIELRAAPLRWYCLDSRVPAVYPWLAAQNARVAFLPLDYLSSEYDQLRYAVHHHRPMVNGLSSFVPREFWKLSSMWRDRAQHDAFLEEIRRLGVDFVVVKGEDFAQEDRDWLRRALSDGRLAFVQRFTGGLEGYWVFAMRAPQRSTADLERFLRKQSTYNDATFGVLDYPRQNETVRNAMFSGWALSPYGVRSVDVLLENGAVRIPTTLLPEPGLNARFPWYDATPRPRFVASIEKRPRNVRRNTDVQVEIVDGRGEHTLLEGRWFTWER